MEAEDTPPKSEAGTWFWKFFILAFAWSLVSLILEAWLSKPVAQGVGHFIVPLVAYPVIKTGRSPRFALWALYCVGFGVLIFLTYKYL
jgi:hypothetical protein